ncbi:hypothetical protein SLEP1_g52049 [Rubroshorea leprosula]|uniref:Uncharacterized protein n=1 Tax=Rubroshorea leprosula TaxID=152421 RepID=A0AAV5M565_9ROSI|nr:hypothetical protein SLEP1_g52049 [Rubroshorea leprosula]
MALVSNFFFCPSFLPKYPIPPFDFIVLGVTSVLEDVYKHRLAPNSLNKKVNCRP